MVAAFCDTNMGSLHLVAPGGRRLELEVAVGLPPACLTTTQNIPITDGVAGGVWGRAASLKKSVIVSDFETSGWEAWRDSAAAAGVDAIWALPLTDGDGQIVGALATYYDTRRHPSREQMEQVARIAKEAVDFFKGIGCEKSGPGAVVATDRVRWLVRQVQRGTTPEKVFEAITTGLKELLRADVVWMQHVPPGGDIKLHQSELLFNRPPVHWRTSPSYEALRRGRPVTKFDFHMSELFPTFGPIYLSTLLCCPITIDGGQLLLSVGWYGPHLLTLEQRHIVDLFAKLGGIAFQNANESGKSRALDYGMTRGLLLSLQMRDFETVAHSRRVGTYASLMAEQLGMDETWLAELSLGAALHDVGKIGIPEKILQKPGPLTAGEFEIVKRHPLIGYDMLKDALQDAPVALNLVRHHHERYDGLGYPDGLQGRFIPQEARMLAVADAFDAMTTDRPYKSARSIDAARREVASLRGQQFCPTCAEAFLSLDEDVLEAVRCGELDGTPFTDLPDFN